MMILFLQQIAGKDELSTKKQIVIWTIIIVFLTGCVGANCYILQKRVKELFFFVGELIRYSTFEFFLTHFFIRCSEFTTV
jgi:hypothetical protein